jgi:hypothetical protein
MLCCAMNGSSADLPLFYRVLFTHIIQFLKTIAQYPCALQPDIGLQGAWILRLSILISYPDSKLYS